MKISAKEEYGLRCLMQLASGPENKAMAAGDIAQAEGLSVVYVNKLLNILAHGGLVKSVRGVKGGYQLAKPANNMSLLEVLRVFDGLFFDEEFCQGYGGLENRCVHAQETCHLRNVWSILGRQMEKTLGQTFLANLVAPQKWAAATAAADNAVTMK